MMLAAALCMAGCGGAAPNHKWDNLRYGTRDNDADYTLPSNYGCLDDSPSSLGRCD